MSGRRQIEEALRLSEKRYRTLFERNLAGVYRSTLEGRILERPRGGGGFGYDPVFFVPGEERTLAELTLDRKNLISHRSRAFRAARDFLERHPEWIEGR